MAQQTLNVGSNANDGTGDTLRNAMIKVNDNFTELYASPLFNDAITISGNEIRANRTNDDLVFRPSGTGSVTFPSIRIRDNHIEGTQSNDDINLVPAGTGSVVFGAIKIQGTSFSSDDSTSINVNEGLIIDGTLKVRQTSNLLGAVDIGSTLDVSGTTTLADLTVTGTTSFAGSGITIDNLTLNDNIISSSSNADIRLEPGGTGSVVISNLTLDSNINITDNIIKTTTSNSDLILNAAGTGNIIVGAITLNGTSLSSTDSSTININEGLVVDGTLNVTGATTLSSTLEVGTNLTTSGNLEVSGTSTLTGTVAIDNLTFNDNIIGSASNADINITPGGTGTVNITDLTIDSNINITDNIIKTTASNSDLVITPSGTGQVVIAKADINGGTIDNTVIGGTTAVEGTFTALSVTTSAVVDGVTISDNSISANRSNDDLILAGSGTGGVTISGLTFPTSDGSNGQFISTDGAGTLSFASAGVSLSHSEIADATSTVSSSAATVINSFAKASFRSAKYFISISDSTNGRFEIVEVNVTHDGSDAYVVSFGSTTSYTDPLCTFTADISGSDVRLIATNISNDSTVFKFQRLVIDV